MVSRILYFVLFYFAWGLCLFGVSSQREWIGPVLVFLLAVAHFIRVDWKRSEIMLSLILTAGGTLLDTLFLNSGLIIYYGGYESFPWLAPLWVSSIWLLFSLTVTTSFAWLKRSPFLTVLLGGCGGVLSYLAAVRAGAASFPDTLKAILVLAALWSILMPLILKLSENECKK